MAEVWDLTFMEAFKLLPLMRKGTCIVRPLEKTFLPVMFIGTPPHGYDLRTPKGGEWGRDSGPLVGSNGVLCGGVTQDPPNRVQRGRRDSSELLKSHVSRYTLTQVRPLGP